MMCAVTAYSTNYTAPANIYNSTEVCAVFFLIKACGRGHGCTPVLAVHRTPGRSSWASCRAYLHTYITRVREADVCAVDRAQIYQARARNR